MYFIRYIILRIILDYTSSLPVLYDTYFPIDLTPRYVYDVLVVFAHHTALETYQVLRGTTRYRKQSAHHTGKGPEKEGRPWRSRGRQARRGTSRENKTKVHLVARKRFKKENLETATKVEYQPLHRANSKLTYMELLLLVLFFKTDVRLKEAEATEKL